jgi:hypothetical protein
MQLEARNPTPEPNDARAVLGGTWRLAYTSNSELIALLALARLPLVTVGEITQEIDPLGQTVENRVELAAPLRWAGHGSEWHRGWHGRRSAMPALPLAVLTAVGTSAAGWYACVGSLAGSLLCSTCVQQDVPQRHRHV